MSLLRDHKKLVSTVVIAVVVGAAVAVAWVQRSTDAEQFERLEGRIRSSIPKRGGLRASPEAIAGVRAIRVVLDRVNADDPERAQTRIRIDEREWLLPARGVAGDASTGSDVETRRTAVFALVSARFAELSALDKDSKGEIETQGTGQRGPDVPHADVIGVLDAFLGAGVKEVNFVGERRVPPKGDHK
jgi:hypothetical protein